MMLVSACARRRVQTSGLVWPGVPREMVRQLAVHTEPRPTSRAGGRWRVRRQATPVTHGLILWPAASSVARSARSSCALRSEGTSSRDISCWVEGIANASLILIELRGEVERGFHLPANELRNRVMTQTRRKHHFEAVLKSLERRPVHRGVPSEQVEQRIANAFSGICMYYALGEYCPGQEQSDEQAVRHDAEHRFLKGIAGPAGHRLGGFSRAARWACAPRRSTADSMAARGQSPGSCVQGDDEERRPRASTHAPPGRRRVRRRHLGIRRGQLCGREEWAIEVSGADARRGSSSNSRVVSAPTMVPRCSAAPLHVGRSRREAPAPVVPRWSRARSRRPSANGPAT